MNPIPGVLGSCANWGSAGVMQFIRQNIPNIVSNGRVLIQETTVAESTKVNGMLDVVKSHLNELEINGNIEIKESTVEGSTQINGVLKAFQTTFSRISISSEAIFLSESKVLQDVIVRPSKEGFKQVLTLERNSRIEGSVIFESGRGEVRCLDGSTILGEVRGTI